LEVEPEPELGELLLPDPDPMLPELSLPVEPLDFLLCFLCFLLVVPDWSPDCPVELPEFPDCPIELCELPDWPMLLPCWPELLPDWLESCANADSEAVRMSANASVNIFFMKRYVL
jgi:hypothetical protein